MADSLHNDSSSDRRLRIRYYTQFLLGAILLAALIAPALKHSQAALESLRNLPAYWLPKDMPTRSDFFQFVEDFSVTDTILITWPSARLEDPSIDRAMQWLEGLSREHNGGPSRLPQPSDSEVHSAIIQISEANYPFLWVRSGTQIVDRLTDRPLNLSKTAAAKRLSGSLVSADGRQTCLILSLAPETSRHHKELLPLIRQGLANVLDIERSDIVLVGGLVDGAVIDLAAIRSVARFSLPSSALAALLCVICLRSLVLSATIISVAMISQGMVLASIYYAGYDLNAVLIILPALVFVLTTSAGVHLSNYFREAVARLPTSSRVDVVRAAIAWGVKPCSLSVLTTIVGLMSLLLVRVQPVQIFGLAASGGLIFSMGMLFLMLPGAMLLSEKKLFKSRTRNVSGGDRPNHSSAGIEKSRSRFQVLLELPLRHRSLVFVFFAALTILASSGLPLLRSSVRIPDMFSEDSEINQDYSWFEEHIGPTLTGELLVAFDKNEEQDPLDRLETVKALHKALSETEGIGGINSALTFLPSLSGSGGMAKVATRAVVRSMLRSENSLLYEFGFLRQSDNEEIWRLTFRLMQTEVTPASQRLNAIAKQTDLVLEGLAPSETPRLAITGHVVIIEKTQQILLQDLVRSFFAALIVIAIFMSIMVGNVVGGLLSMIPNTIPTLVLFGMMGYLNLPLDIGSVMTASVAMGIAVDDSLHLLSHFRAGRRKGMSLDASTKEALKYCGLAMLQTTIICGCSLAVYFASEFRPTQRFAIFMGVLLTIAWLGVAFLLPAMLTSRLGRWFGSR